MTRSTDCLTFAMAARFNRLNVVAVATTHFIVKTQTPLSLGASVLNPVVQSYRAGV